MLTPDHAWATWSPELVTHGREQVDGIVVELHLPTGVQRFAISSLTWRFDVHAGVPFRVQRDDVVGAAFDEATRRAARAGVTLQAFQRLTPDTVPAVDIALDADLAQHPHRLAQSYRRRAAEGHHAA